MPVANTFDQGNIILRKKLVPVINKDEVIACAMVFAKGETHLLTIFQFSIGLTNFNNAFTAIGRRKC